MCSSSDARNTYRFVIQTCVARQAGLGAEWYVELEPGRAVSPSSETVEGVDDDANDGKENRMIKVNVMYPYTEGARFDHAYYRDRHMPMVKARLGSACAYYTVEKGLAGRAPGDRKSTRLNSSHTQKSRMPSSA